MQILADDAAPRILDQLPAEAWNFGPLFVIAITVLISLLGLIWYAARRFDKHASETITMIRAHLKDNEATNRQIQLTQVQNQITMAAMEVRLQTNICRLPHGNGTVIQPG